jgi:hypothetical protein
MNPLVSRLSVVVLAIAASIAAGAQTPAAEGFDPALVSRPVPDAHGSLEAIAPQPPLQPLLDFKSSDVKFDISQLMDILEDRRHEGWILAAYPDPKTNRPLIGAGFSLDLPSRDHPQRDLLNPHPFLEPSSADLWQAAGLAPERLQSILNEFSRRQARWSRKQFRKQIRNLEPEISDEDATRLLRIAAIQAIYNARGYCRDFDHLTASQQMALSQLVYQMGVNLEEFSQFLGLVNHDDAAAAALSDTVVRGPDYWKQVQLSLVQSQWARLYRTRAVSVIAMLDPAYEANPAGAERSIATVLRPAVVRRHRGHSAGMVQVASHGHGAGRARKNAARARKN